jgi:hypothetical protein
MKAIEDKSIFLFQIIIMNKIFKDLYVVELANVLAGPASGMFFAELGAKVTKIENTTTNGDITRNWKLESENKSSNMSAYYASANWGKKVLMMDLTKEKDKQKVYKLIKNADIVITNYKAGDDKKLGMDYKTLKKINPQIIYAHLSGFGENNKRTAFDLVLQAESGFMFMNGTPESGPVKMPVALIDLLAAHQLKEGILTAIINKMRTGRGSKVSVSLFDSAVASLANQASNWLMAKHNPTAIGSIHPNIAPYGERFITKDKKQLVLAIGSNKQFAMLCAILNAEKLTTKEEYKTNTNRVINRVSLKVALEKEIRKFNSKELMDEFINNDVPAGIIKSIKEVFESKAEMQNHILEEKNGMGLSKRVRTVVFKISS